MFSLQRIRQKINPKKKARGLKESKAKECAEKSFISLEPSLLRQGDGDAVTEVGTSGSETKNKLSWRYYQKLGEEELNLASTKPEATDFQTPDVSSKPKLLKLDKTAVYIEKRCKVKKKREARDRMNKYGNVFKDKKMNRPKYSKGSKIKKLDRSTYSETISENTNLEDINLQSISDMSIEVTRDKKVYIDAHIIDEESLLLAFYPGTEIYFNGNVRLTQVAGQISILGYEFQTGESRPVFSPPSHSWLSFKIVNGVYIKQYSEEEMEKLSIPVKWIEQLDINKDCSVGLVKFTRFETNSTRLIEASSLFHCKDGCWPLDKILKDVLNVEFFDGEAARSMGKPILQESPNWQLYVERVLHTPPTEKQYVIVVTGGKDVGKSTFLKYFINQLLRLLPIGQIACLDLDPGQPEFSLPTVLSLTRISGPVLGPAHSHINGVDLSDQRQIILGDLSVSNMLQEYLSIVKKLIIIYKKDYSDIPLIVNTMGYTAHIGFDIMLDVLRIVQPTHVMTIRSSNNRNNFFTDIKADLVNHSNRGILEMKTSGCLNYDFQSLLATAHMSASIGNKELRDLRVLAYLSKLWKTDEQNLVALNCKPSIKVPWSSMAIHIPGSFIPPSCVLEAINASLIALCHIDEECLESVAENCPLRVQIGSPLYISNECLGWGIVRGIDPTTEELHILTTLNEEVVLTQVNLLVMTRLFLPNYFFKLFSGGSGPYMQKKGRSGKLYSGMRNPRYKGKL